MVVLAFGEPRFEGSILAELERAAGAGRQRCICRFANGFINETTMPGLLRGMARTAAVVGTATATRNAVNRRQAQKNAAAYSQAYAQAAPAQEPQYAEPAPAPAPEDDVITQLERLGNLYAQGILTEDEFAAQKARLLGA